MKWASREAYNVPNRWLHGNEQNRPPEVFIAEVNLESETMSA